MQKFINQHDLIIAEAAVVEPIRRGGIVELDPTLANGPLIYDELGRRELRKLYVNYANIALAANLPFLMCTPTWRTNAERVKTANADPNINRHAAEFLFTIRDELNSALVKVGGQIGCKNDCYQPEEALTTSEAETFHQWQIEELAAAGVDFLLAVTLPNIAEALGIARAMAATKTPYFISFVIDRSGNVLDGTPLSNAIEFIDNEIDQPPLGYMINCAYPTFLSQSNQPPEKLTRLIGFQGNASSLDHADLDGAKEIKMNDTAEWGETMLELHRQWGIKILGGCCGTNTEHLKYIVANSQALTPKIS